MGYTMDLGEVWVTRWVYERCGLHDGSTRGMGYTMGLREVWVTRWVYERCGLHDGSTHHNNNMELSSLPPCRRALVQHQE